MAEARNVPERRNAVSLSFYEKGKTPYRYSKFNTYFWAELARPNLDEHEKYSGVNASIVYGTGPREFLCELLNSRGIFVFVCTFFVFFGIGIL